MTGDKALLSQFVEKTGPTITFGDNSKCYTVGYGRLEIGNVVVMAVFGHIDEGRAHPPFGHIPGGAVSCQEIRKNIEVCKGASFVLARPLT